MGKHSRKKVLKYSFPRSQCTIFSTVWDEYQFWRHLFVVTVIFKLHVINLAEINHIVLLKEEKTQFTRWFAERIKARINHSKYSKLTQGCSKLALYKHSRCSSWKLAELFMKFQYLEINQVCKKYIYSWRTSNICNMLSIYSRGSDLQRAKTWSGEKK